MRVLVTGGAGYAGSRVVRFLLSKDLHVRVLDTLEYGTGLDGDLPVEFIRGSVLSKPKLREALDGVDMVVHLAAARGEACEKNPDYCMKVNVEGTRNLIECMGWEQKLVFASTCSVYGAQKDMLHEKSDPSPVGAYAASKLEAEKLVLDSSIIPGIVLRFGTAFGYSEPFRKDLILHEYIREAHRDKKITVYHPQAWRPLIHVDDYAKAVWFALSSLEQGNIYNVACGNFRKGDLAAQVAEWFPATIFFEEMGPDIRDYRVDCSKIGQAGWRPSIQPEQGIKELTMNGVNWDD